MGGFLGFGTPSTVKTDRNNQLAATKNLNNVFNYAMPTAQTQQTAGNTALSDANAYWSNLMQAGRQQTAQNAAPAINAQQDQADAQKRQEAQSGTGRTGGTAEVNRESGAATTKNIDDIINQTMQSQKNQAAQGEAAIGSAELGDASNLLGLGAGAENSVMNNAEGSRVDSAKIAQQQQSQLGQTIGGMIVGALGF